jgi:hypothetical protein
LRHIRDNRSSNNSSTSRAAAICTPNDGIISTSGRSGRLLRLNNISSGTKFNHIDRTLLARDKMAAWN